MFLTIVRLSNLSDMLNFSKLPAHEHERVIKFIEQKDLAALIAIHNRYELSSARYCCQSTAQRLLQEFEQGVRLGFIKKHEQQS